MKRVLKIFALAATLSLLSLPIFGSCSSDDSTYHFNWTALTATNMLYTETIVGEGEEAVVTDRGFEETSRTEFDFGRYGLRATLQSYIVVDGAHEKKSDWSLFPSARAAEVNRYELVEKVVSIIVTTTNNLDASHPAGSDVTEYFRALHEGEPVAVADMIPVLNDTVFPGLLSTVYPLDMYLAQPHTEGDLHSFTVEVTFESGRTISSQTPEVTLLKPVAPGN